MTASDLQPVVTETAAFASLPDVIARMSAGQLRQILIAAFDAADQAGRGAIIDHAKQLAVPRKRAALESMKGIARAHFQNGLDVPTIAGRLEMSERRVRKLLSMVKPRRTKDRE